MPSASSRRFIVTSDAARDHSPPCARPSCRREPLAVAQLRQCRLSQDRASRPISQSISPMRARPAPSSAYDVDAYTLIVASDSDRSAEAKLPASTYKIPNSLIALETGVVAGPRQGRLQMGRRQARRSRPGTRTTRCARAIAASAVPVYQEIARRIGAGAHAEICRPARIRQSQYRRRHRPVLADRRSAHRSGPAGRFPRPAAARRAAGLQAQPGSGRAISCR